jgi:hypothetical protein
MAMSGTEYKVLLDGKAVDRKVYDMIETITVDQGIDLMTEARVELEMCADDKGNWNGLGEDYTKTWRRIRIEVRNGTSTWVPLIDGPVVAKHAQMSGEPGQSMLTLTAYDDSIYLNRTATVKVFEGQSDEDVARQLLRQDPIKDVELDTFANRPPERKLQHIQRGTEIDLLREIAAPNGMHVYIRPGSDAGTSVGCMKRIDPHKKPTLPALVLSGPERNIETFSVRDDVQKAGKRAGAQLDIGDLTIKTKESSWRDVELLGDESNVEDQNHLATELVPPIFAAFFDVEQVANYLQQLASHTVIATGSVRLGCYKGVLTPYDVVDVSGVDQKLCTRFVIREVTHTLARSEYRQEFTLTTNAVAKVDRQGSPIPLEIL